MSQFSKQWADLPHKFELNVEHFKSSIGPAVAEEFKRNFSRRAWGGSSWPARKDHKPHPLLFETGSLRNSISVKRLHQKVKKKVEVHTNDEEPLYAQRNSTDPHRWGARISKRREYAFVYAAIHNEGGKIATPGSPASHIKQRKFMGDDSPAVDRIIRFYSRYIFEGFPQ